MSKVSPHVTAYAIGCPHPAARDGVVYCLAPYTNDFLMRQGYEHFFADTKKLIELGAPNLSRHEDAPAPADLARLLGENSPTNPLATGTWSYSASAGLKMSSGNGAIIRFIEGVRLPYFPVAV